MSIEKLVPPAAAVTNLQSVAVKKIPDPAKPTKVNEGTGGLDSAVQNSKSRIEKEYKNAIFITQTEDPHGGWKIDLFAVENKDGKAEVVGVIRKFSDEHNLLKTDIKISKEQLKTRQFDVESIGDKANMKEPMHEKMGEVIPSLYSKPEDKPTSEPSTTPIVPPPSKQREMQRVPPPPPTPGGDEIKKEPERLRNPPSETKDAKPTGSDQINWEIGDAFKIDPYELIPAALDILKQPNPSPKREKPEEVFAKRDPQ